MFLVTGDHPATAEALARQVHERRKHSNHENVKSTESNGKIDFGNIDQGIDEQSRRISSNHTHNSDGESTGQKSSAYESGDITDISSDYSLENLPTSNWSYEVVHGEFIQKLTEDDWKRIFTQQFVIFARTTPTQRMHLVKVN